MKPSMVSVSRTAGPPHTGQVVFDQVGCVASGDFQASVDPVQLYISIAALCFFYLSNSATLSVIFGRDLLNRQAKDERLDHMVALVLAALTGKSPEMFGREQAPSVVAPAHHSV